MLVKALFMLGLFGLGQVVSAKDDAPPESRIKVIFTEGTGILGSDGKILEGPGESHRERWIKDDIGKDESQRTVKFVILKEKNEYDPVVKFHVKCTATPLKTPKEVATYTVTPDIVSRSGKVYIEGKHGEVAKLVCEDISRDEADHGGLGPHN